VRGDYACISHDACRTELFSKLGKVEELPDEIPFSALSASTSAIATHFRYLSLITQWLHSKRVPKQIAQRQISGTFSGVAKELADQTTDFEVLAKMYATLGGINAQFLQEMEKSGLPRHVVAALEAVFARLTDSDTH
jgi:pyrroline-5-carboxylate reductase